MAGAWYWNKIQNQFRQSCRKRNFRKSSSIWFNKPYSGTAAVLAMSSADHEIMRLHVVSQLFPFCNLHSPPQFFSSTIQEDLQHGELWSPEVLWYNTLAQTKSLSYLTPANQLDSTSAYFHLCSHLISDAMWRPCSQWETSGPVQLYQMELPEAT